MQKEIQWLLKEKYFGKPTAQFNKDVARLKKGEPLDYLIGFCEFLGCKIDLSKKPLIPRPETEYWVGQVIKELPKNKLLKVLDIFSGSGCIGVSIMRHNANATVVFAEKDNTLVSQIKINCVLNNIDKKRYRVLQSDMFKNVKGKFDYIFANPPYIPTARKQKIQKSVLAYEPHAALFGGQDGLAYIKKFLVDARHFLHQEGSIYMEFDSIQKKEIEKLLKKYDYADWRFYKDQYKKFRYVKIALV